MSPGRLLARVVALVEWWAMGLLVAMVALVTVGVFFRYVLDASLSWYDEFASYLLVWLSFYGAVAATHRDHHIRFEALVERLGPGARRALAAVSEASSLLFYGVLLVYGAVLVRAVGHETAVSIQWVPMGLVYSALPISGGLMLAVGLVRFARLLRGEPSPERQAPTAASGE